MMVPCDVRNLLALHVLRTYYEELVKCVRPTPLLHAWKSSEAPFLMMQLAIPITVLRHDHVQYPPSSCGLWTTCSRCGVQNGS